ncbi:hypothetical protein BGZ76_005781, partial [Entomortierella beljakovae]
MSQEFLNWALEEGDKEHVSMGNFVRTFGLTDRDSATKSFENLIKSTRIPLKRRESLLDEYCYFVSHHADRFWTKHLLNFNTEQTAQELALAAQDAAVEEAKSAY